MRVLLRAAVAAFVVACGGSASAPPRISPAGAWTSVNGTSSLTMTLTENTGVVTGAGQFTQAGSSVALTISGTYAAPSISLVMTAQGFQPMNFSGSVSASQMTGSLNGSGFSNFTWIFARQ